MPRSTYYDQLVKLESFGFLVPPAGKGSMYHFYEDPQSSTQDKNVCEPEKTEKPPDGQANPAKNQTCP